MKLLRGSRARAGASSPALDQAASLEERGRCLEAIELLSEANRAAPNAAIEVRLVQLRNRAFAELGLPGSEYVAPQPVPLRVDPEDRGVPAIPRWS